MGPNTLPRTLAPGEWEAEPDRPVWTTPYGLDPSVFYAVSGGEDEDDDPDDDDEDDDEDDDRGARRPSRSPRGGRDGGRRSSRRDEDEEDEDDEDEVVLSRAEHDRLTASLKRARGEAAQRRKYLRDNGISYKTGRPSQRRAADRDEDDDRDDRRSRDRDDRRDRRESARAIRAAEARAYEEGEREAREGAWEVITALPTTLEAAGFNGTSGQQARVIKYLAKSGADLADADELEDAISDIKDDFPEWFKGRRSRRRAPARDTDGGGDGRRSGTLRTSDRRRSNGSGTRSDPNAWARSLGKQAGVISDRDE